MRAHAHEIDKEFEMLVLSRKVGERIHVGDDIILEIRRITGNRVTLALDAPRNVRILRGELEKAARDFRSSHTHSASHVPPPVTDMHVLNSLSSEAVGRDYAI